MAANGNGKRRFSPRIAAPIRDLLPAIAPVTYLKQNSTTILQDIDSLNKQSKAGLYDVD
jgi:hypothetical protein